MIVRSTLVTGMPSITLISPGLNVGLRCRRIPAGALRPLRTVTWIAPSLRRRSRAAAAVW
jgi:hypothetical protein